MMTWVLAFFLLTSLALYIWGVFESMVDTSAPIPAPVDAAFIIATSTAIFAIFLQAIK